MKKLLAIFLSILVLAGGFLMAFLNSDYYYSNKLVVAIKEENIVEVKQILEKRPSCINTYPSITPKWWHSAMNWRVLYPLTEACCTGNLDLITLMIEKGADVNCNDGLTPLSVTYGGKGKNWYAVSLLLIENGASLDYITEYSGGKTCILQNIVQVRGGAALPGYVPESTEEIMLAFDYAIKNCDHSKIEWMRVLQQSVSNDRLEIVKFLLDQGYCDVNDTSVGMTALMFAVRDSTPEMVKLLIDYGADKSYKSSNGKTAYDYAVQSGDKSIISILEK